MRERLSIRIDAANPNHHLWLNTGSWWIHYTIHIGDGRQRRVRYSLETLSLEQARVLRDAVFAAWGEPQDLLTIPPIEVSDFDGLALRCSAPDPGSAGRLARIDRGANMLGTLDDDFYVAVDNPWDPGKLVLWMGIDQTQLDAESYITPVAWLSLARLGSETRGDARWRAGAAHLLHAWIARHAGEHYEEDHRVEGGDLLDTPTVRHVLASACRGLPLDLDHLRTRRSA